MDKIINLLSKIKLHNANAEWNLRKMLNWNDSCVEKRYECRVVYLATKSICRETNDRNTFQETIRPKNDQTYLTIRPVQTMKFSFPCQVRNYIRRVVFISGCEQTDELLNRLQRFEISLFLQCGWNAVEI